MKWEDILSKYGLSEGQLSTQDVQYCILPPKECRRNGPFPIDNDPDLKPGKAWPADNDHEVERKFTNRDVPFWALSDKKIARFLRHRHTSVNLIGKESTFQFRNAKAREAAARTVAHIYLAWRAGWQNCDVANLLGTTEGNVDKFLARIKEEADVFFAKRVPAKDVLLHNCHTVGDPQPKKCKCKMYLNHDNAREQVRQGLADWLIIYPPNAKAYPSHAAIVAVRAKKTPRSAMLEKAQIERNVGASGDAGHNERASVEAFKEMMFQWLVDLKVPFKPDGRDGMPVITHWQDQRDQ